MIFSTLCHSAKKQGQYLFSHIYVKLCGKMLVTKQFKVHSLFKETLNGK